MSRVKINTRKNLIGTKLFDVDELSVSYAEKTDIFHGIYVKPAVIVIALTESKELYLTKQHRYIKDKIYLELVSGMIEDGEDPLTAGKRELEEEAGIKANKWLKLPEIELGSSIGDWDFNYYLASDFEFSTQKLDQSEDIEVVKMPLEKAVEKIYNGEIVKLSTVAGILLVNSMLKDGKIV